MSSQSPYFNETVNPGVPQGAPPKKSNKTLWLILGCGGGLILLGLLCCGGFVGLGFFGINMASDQIKAQIANDPAIQENIGEIQEMGMDFGATGAEAQKNQNNGGQASTVFSIKGSKGSGQVLVTPVQNGPPTMTLRKSDGTEIPLQPTAVQ